MRRCRGLGWLLPLLALLLPLAGSYAAPSLALHSTVADFSRGTGDGGLRVTGQRGGELALVPRALGLTPWTELAAAALPRTLRDHSALAANGALFVAGGESDAGYEAAVYRAAIGLDGTLGAWQPQPALPRPILRHAMVRAGDSLLVIGGLERREPQTPVATVYRAPLGPDGSLGAWAELAATPLPRALSDLGAAVVGGYLFAIGGEPAGGPRQATVYRAPLKADDTLGAWEPALPIPVALTGHAVATAGNCLFVTGGQSDSGSPRSEVYSAAVGVDGRIAAWQKLDSTRLPRPLESHTATVIAGQLVVTGGSSDAPDYDRPEVYRAGIRDDCTLEPWQELAGAALPRRVTDHAAAAAGGYLFVAGGHRLGNAQQYAMVYRAAIIPDQDLGGWRAAGQAPLPLALSGHSAVLTDDDLFVTGGRSDAGVQSEVYGAAAPADGRVGEWVAATPLPRPLYEHVTVAAGGRLLTIGGNDGVADQATVYEAPIGAGGALGEWRTHPCALPVALSAHAAVAAGDSIYMSGGRHGFEEQSAVYRLKQDDDGTGGCWQALAALPRPLADHAMVAAGGALYVTGGVTAAGGDISQAVYRAPIMADRTLGAWVEQSASPLPTFLRSHTLSAANGFLYVVGGYGAFAQGAQYRVYQAPLLPDGSGIGAWRELDSTPLPQGLYNHAAVVSDLYLLVLGGYQGGQQQSGVYATALYKAAHVGVASAVFDLGQDVDIGALAWQARGDPDTTIRVRYRVAPDATAEYGPWTEAGAAPISVYTRGRYVQYQVALASPEGGVKAIDEISLTYGDVGDYVRVLDERGASVPGAQVYLNGRLVGATDQQGVVPPSGLPALHEGHQLVALSPISQTESFRPAHATSDSARVDWAYRTTITNLAVSDTGEVIPHRVEQPGGQVVVLRPDQPLVLYNLVVSIEWAANITYTAEISRAVHAASQFLFDVSDGQMAFGYVTIYTNALHWNDADLQISARNSVQPHAYVGGIVSPDRSHVIRVGRHWDGNSAAQGPWDQPDGYRTLVHEFGHYALALYDEYFAYVFDKNGNVTRRQTTYCTAPPAQIGGADATNASIMDYQYNRSEFAMRGVAGMWSAWCQQTLQAQMNNGESDWETIIRRYGDGANPPRWRLRTPADRGRALAGPEGLPGSILPFPVVTIPSGMPASPDRTLVVYGPQGPYKEALVVLRTNQQGYPVAIDQGFTDESGRIAIYGAQVGDILRAASLDGALNAQVQVDDALAYEMTLAPPAALLALAAADLNPYFTIQPGSDGYTLDLALHGLRSGGTLLGVVTQAGGANSQPTTLSYDRARNAYTGSVSFSAAQAQRGTGMAQVIGVGPDSRGISLSATYALQAAARDRANDLFAADGNLHIHLITDTLPVDTYAVLLPLSALPTDPPEGWLIAGNAYDAGFSGGQLTTSQPFVLALHYDLERLKRDFIDVATLRIYRWEPDPDPSDPANQARWVALDSARLDEDHSVSVATSRLGIYALMGFQVADTAYLPMIAR